MAAAKNLPFDPLNPAIRMTGDVNEDMADKFWEYVAEYIEQINFAEIDDKQYDLLFSNVSTAIMGKK